MKRIEELKAIEFKTTAETEELEDLEREQREVREFERYLAEQRKLREGQDATRKITDYLNNRNARYIVMGMAQEHRTLQQNFTRLCVAWLEHLASLQDGQFDLRNQASVELARKLAQTDVWPDAKYLPYI